MFGMPNYTKKKDQLPFRAHFYSDEGTEDPHVHIEVGSGGADGKGKWWLRNLKEAYSYRFKQPMEKLVLKTLKKKQAEWLQIWHDFFGTSEEN